MGEEEQGRVVWQVSLRRSAVVASVTRRVRLVASVRVCNFQLLFPAISHTLEEDVLLIFDLECCEGLC